jgi:4-amino-4-deoxy-L-arabinose transferase-like glycosyltransferase
MQTKSHFSIMATSFAGGPRPRNVAVILFGLWALLFFASLFAPPLLDDADATHAQAAQAMVRTGDLVTLRVDGVRYLEKAPLPYWLTAASFRLFGFNTFAAHLPTALTVLLLMLLGHRWANQAFGARTGFYTALALLTSLGVFLFTRILIPEALLSLTLGAALFAFLKAVNPDGIGIPGLRGHRVPDTLQPPRYEWVGGAPPPEAPAVAWYAGPLFYPYVMWASLALAVLA